MKIQLKRSGILEGGFAKEPTAEQLEHGELAVNFNATDPSIFIKNSDNAVVKISGAGSAGSFDGDYNSLINQPTIGNGNINISAGNGLTASGLNATANQTGPTTRVLTAKAGNSTILVDADGIKVQSANITPDWNNIQNKPGTVGGKTLTNGNYISGNPYDGSTNRTWNVLASESADADRLVARDSSGDIYSRYCYGTYMNMSHAVGTRSSDTVFYSSTDDFIRKTDAAGMRDSLSVPTRSGTNATGTWGINITGSAGSASSATTATNATNARIDHDTGNAWHRIVMVDDGKSSGTNNRLKTDSAATIAINPSTNQVRATTFVGALSGNATSATTATSATNADTVDNLHASSFIRADANDTATGSITFNGRVNIRGHIDLADSENLDFGSSDDVRIYYNSNNWLYCDFRTGAGIIFQDNGSNKMRLEDGGIFRPEADGGGSIGTTDIRWANGYFDNAAITSTLTVRGAIDLADNDILRFGSSDDCELFCNGSHMYMDLNSGIGNFYIRDGSTNRFTFDDAGHFTATGDVRSASDIRLKENLTAIEDPIGKLDQLNGYHYYRTDTKEHQYGVIAQEVEKVFPDMVKEDEESGFKNVAYNQLVPVLLEAVKDLSAQVAELKSQIS